MLAEAEADTQQLKEELDALEGVKTIAPTIIRA
jgi:phage terminase Nu1 subunit (DNA packaging protein)